MNLDAIVYHNFGRVGGCVPHARDEPQPLLLALKELCDRLSDARDKWQVSGPDRAARGEGEEYLYLEADLPSLARRRDRPLYPRGAGVHPDDARSIRMTRGE